MGLANDPCWASALPEELRFVLLARDPDAPEVVRDWVRRRLARHFDEEAEGWYHLRGHDLRITLSDSTSVPLEEAVWLLSALELADLMEEQRADVRQALGKPA